MIDDDDGDVFVDVTASFAAAGVVDVVADLVAAS